MAIEKIAEMFAELGFKVDTKGLVLFESHLNNLKKSLTEVKVNVKSYSAASVESDKKVRDSSRSTTNALIKDRQRLMREFKSRAPNGMPVRGGGGSSGGMGRFAFSGGGGMFGGLGAIVAGVATNRTQLQTEATQAKMGMVLSDEDSATQMKFASDNARALGTNAIAAAAGYADLVVQATRMDIPLKDTQNLFMGVSEASVAMGLSMDQQKGIYKAFSDMLAKGTVNAEELNLLAPFHSDMIGLAA